MRVENHIKHPLILKNPLDSLAWLADARNVDSSGIYSSKGRKYRK
jgi:hypothetical protein